MVELLQPHRCSRCVTPFGVSAIRCPNDHTPPMITCGECGGSGWVTHVEIPLVCGKCHGAGQVHVRLARITRRAA